MNERILVSSVINGAELLHSLALRMKNNFVFRVLPPVALAETALVRCGKYPEKKRLRPDEQQVIVGGLMQQAKSFFSEVFSFQDAANLTEALNGMRLRFADSEAEGLHKALSQGEFQDKNSALLDVYDRYIELLRKESKIDDVGLIRYALAQAAELDAEFLILKEFALSPLEEALVLHLSGSKQRAVSIQELFSAQPSDALRVDSFTETYGSVNEVDQLIKDLYDRDVPLDQSVVAVTEPMTYGQLFFDLAMEKGVPVTFGCGIPITNAKPANLLSLWSQWNSTGFFGIDALQSMLYSDSFNRSALMDLLNQGRKEEEGSVSLRRLTELAGSLRLGPDSQTNESRITAWQETLSESSEDLQWAEALHLLGQELALPCAVFLKKYAFIRGHSVGGPLDQSARQAILEVLDLAGRFPELVKIEDLIPLALNQSIGTEQAKPGHLHITTVEGALSVQRRHLYVLGLNADLFPGRSKENALVLDKDWELMPCPETAPTSKNRIIRARNSLTTLSRMAASLGEDVHLYWSNSDLSALNKLNPSSAIYDFRRRFPRIDVRKIGYFPAVYSEAYAISRLYMEGRDLPAPEKTQESIPQAKMDPEEREWSPSAIDTWFACKRKFLFQYILRLDVEESDDPMEVISAAEIGNLAHNLMEQMAVRHPNQKQFKQMASEMFDTYLLARPPMDKHAAEREKSRFTQMMDAAWKHDPGRKVVLSEEKMQSRHPCGLRLTGRPDRVELDKNGKAIVVDFKTGNKVMQQEDDPSTYRQALIYAWMLQQDGMEIDHCEYRYLRQSTDVICSTSPEVMKNLDEDLSLFHHGLSECDFALENGYGQGCDDETCRYCPYSAICQLDKTPKEGTKQ